MSGFNSSPTKDKFFGSESATLSGTKAVRKTEPSGVATGLSERMSFDSTASEKASDPGVRINYKVDPLTGNSTERLEPRVSESVSGKNGSFDLIG